MKIASNQFLWTIRADCEEDEEDDGIPFEEKMADFSAILKEQMKKEVHLNQEIKDQLSNIGVKV